MERCAVGHYADGQLRGSGGQRRVEEERRLSHGIYLKAHSHCAFYLIATAIIAKGPFYAHKMGFTSGSGRTKFHVHL